MATINNYYQNTKATFKFLGVIDRDDVVSWQKYGKHFNLQLPNKAQWQTKLARLTNLPSHEFTLLHDSFNHTFRTGSFYFYHAKTNTLYRVSDHWSDTNYPVNANIVMNIRSCFWTLKLTKQQAKTTIFKAKRARYYNYVVAKCKLSNFRIWQNENESTL